VIIDFELIQIYAAKSRSYFRVKTCLLLQYLPRNVTVIALISQSSLVIPLKNIFLAMERYAVRDHRTRGLLGAYDMRSESMVLLISAKWVTMRYLNVKGLPNPLFCGKCLEAIKSSLIYTYDVVSPGIEPN
jgi:hypothetical protein